MKVSLFGYAALTLAATSVLLGQTYHLGSNDVFAGYISLSPVPVDPTGACTNPSPPVGITWVVQPVLTVLSSASNSVFACFGTWTKISGGTPGSQGPAGPSGSSGTVAIGTTTTLTPSAPASVANVGTSSAAVLNFGIPQGLTGNKGDTGNGNEIIKWALCRAANCVVNESTGSNLPSQSTTIVGCRAYADTAPVGGGGIVIDVQVGGHSIFSGTALTIASGNNASTGTDAVVGDPLTSFTSYAVVGPLAPPTAIVTQVGSTGAGAGLSVTCWTLATSVLLGPGQMMLGDLNGVATPITISGDFTISNTGVGSVKSSLGLTGNPTTPNQTTGDSSTKIANTGFVATGLATKVGLTAGGAASIPALSSDPGSCSEGDFYRNLTNHVLRVCGVGNAWRNVVHETHKFIFCAAATCNNDTSTIADLVVYPSTATAAYFTIGTAATTSTTVQCLLSGGGNLFSSTVDLNGHVAGTTFDASANLNTASLAALSTIKNCAITGTSGSNIELVVITR